jgi:hypothetical protein
MSEPKTPDLPRAIDPKKLLVRLRRSLRTVEAQIANSRHLREQEEAVKIANRKAFLKWYKSLEKAVERTQALLAKDKPFLLRRRIYGVGRRYSTWSTLCTFNKAVTKIDNPPTEKEFNAKAAKRSLVARAEKLRARITHVEDSSSTKPIKFSASNYRRYIDGF